MYHLRRTENKPSLFLRYPFQIVGPTFVEIPKKSQVVDINTFMIDFSFSLIEFIL